MQKNQVVLNMQKMKLPAACHRVSAWKR